MNYLLRNEILQNGYGFKDLYFSFVPRFMNRQFYQYQFDIDRNEGEFISVAFLDNFIGYFSDIYDKQYQYQEQLVSPTRISDNNTGYHDSGDESGYDSGYDKYGNINIQYSPPNSQRSDNSDNEDDPSKSPRWNFLPAVQNKFKKGIDARAKRAEEATQRQRDKKDEILAERRGQNLGYVPNYGGTRKNKRKQPKKYKSYNRKNKNKTKSNRKSKKHNKSKNKRKPKKSQRKYR